MNTTVDQSSWQPIHVPNGTVKEFAETHPGISVVDEMRRNCEELFLLRNPKYKFDKNYQDEFKKFFNQFKDDGFGNWFYFPWSNLLVRYLPEDLHQELRTGRNKHLITEEEQRRFYDATIAFLGMSVGSHVATTIAMTGGARHIKLADPDTLSGDNLNRIRTGFQNVGTKKVIAVARQIYEMNPYAEVALFDEGLTEENMVQFLQGLDVLVEEMDNPYLKIKVRFEARVKKIPIVMAADNGDGIIADVERFDLEPERPILHGLLGSMTPEDLKNVAPRDLPRVVTKIVGPNLAHLRALESVFEVGKSIYSWPQLGTAATMCGSVLAYLARRIALRDPKIKSGRFEVNPDSIFEHEYHTAHETAARAKQRAEILKKMGIE